MESNKKPNLLNLTTDIVFKIFFKENPHLLKELLRDFLPFQEGSEIAEIELLDTEENLQEGKTFLLDLKVRLLRKEGGKDMGRETVNVEVQTVAKRNFTNRLLAYAGRVYSGQIKEGEDYKTLYPFYSLVFSTVNLKEFTALEKEYYHRCMMLRDCPPHLPLTEGIQFVVVELSKFVKSLEKVLDQRDAWCYLLRKSEKMSDEDLEVLKTKGESMGEAVRKLWDLSQNELMRERLEAVEKQKKDRVAEIEYARDEGMEKGREEGREEGIKKIALAMMSRGVDLDTISGDTGLSKEELEKLRKDLKK